MNHTNDFENFLDKEYAENARIMLKHIKQLRHDTILNSASVLRAVHNGTIDRMIRHFQDSEDYEFCAELMQFKNKLQCV